LRPVDQTGIAKTAMKATSTVAVWCSWRGAAGTSLRTAVPAVGMRVVRFRVRMSFMARAGGARPGECLTKALPLN